MNDFKKGLKSHGTNVKTPDHYHYLGGEGGCGAAGVIMGITLFVKKYSLQHRPTCDPCSLATHAHARNRVLAI